MINETRQAALIAQMQQIAATARGSQAGNEQAIPGVAAGHFANVLDQMQQMSAVARGEAVTGVSAPSNTTDFSGLLGQMVDKVNDSQKASAALQRDFTLGDKQVDMAEVMVAMQKARVHFETMVQVRNRLVSAYEEIMRMPV